MNEHNKGKCYWTKRYAPFEVVYYEAYRSPDDAKEREKKLKCFKKSYSELKKRIIRSLSEDNFTTSVVVGGGRDEYTFNISTYCSNNSYIRA